MAALTSVTSRYDGIVSYADGSKRPFRGTFDSRYPEGQVGSDDVIGSVMAQMPGVATAINAALSPATIRFTPTTDPGIGTVVDAVVTVAGQVTYDDNTQAAFTVIYEKGVARLIGSIQAVVDLATDTTGIKTQFDAGMQAASGEPLELWIPSSS